MQHVNLSFFVELGGSIALLKSFAKREADVPFFEAWPPLGDLMEKLSRLVDNGHPIRLETSANPAYTLLTELRGIRQRHFDGPDGVLDTSKNWGASSVPAWEFVVLSIDFFHNVLAAEFTNSATFTVPQRWGYRTPTLILDAASCAELGGREDFQGTPLIDFREAGKCLAFEMPTASGFHSARAVEAILQRYYRAFIGPVPERATMGYLVPQLEEASKAKGVEHPDQRTVITLREIKDLDRNPLAHPEATLDMVSAKALFELAGIAIWRMLNEIDQHGSNGPVKMAPPEG
ncbi:hypothetical protein [Bosea sp. R86505]|uniref:hypothetical protein n=1 Tax=Bosea sp. R86505 TaxID=3101710 RepID=UPI00367135AA